MKKIIFIFLLTSFISFGQEKFTYGGTGLNTTFIINKAESFTQQQIFDKALTWASGNLQNSDIALDKKVEGNEKITFTGFRKNYINFSALGNQIYFNVRYTVALAFKEGRYKFEIVKLEKKLQGHNQKGRDWVAIPLNNGSKLYDKKGKLTNIGKAETIKIPQLLNELNDGLLSHIKSVAKPKDNGDW